MKRYIQVCTILIASLAFCLLSFSADQSNSLIVLKASRLFNGTGAAPISSAVVVIRGDTIQSAGPSSQISIPKGVQVIDLGNDTILPGLIDAHCHLRYRYMGGGHLGRTAQAQEKEGVIAMRIVKNVRTQLLCGITTVRMVGEVRNLDFDIQGSH